MLRSLTVVHTLGLMLIMFSATYLLPIITSLIYQDGHWIDFFLAMGATFLAGCLMWLLTRRFKSELSIRFLHQLLLQC